MSDIIKKASHQQKNNQSYPVRGTSAEKTVQQQTEHTEKKQNEQFKKKTKDTQLQNGEFMSEFIDEYKEKNGSASRDYTTLMTRRKNKLNDFLTIAITALFLLLIVAAAGFFIFTPEVKHGNKVELSISGPDEVISGKEVTITIKVRNQESVEIGNVLTELFVPDNFIVKNTDPSVDDVTKKRLAFKDDQINVGSSKEIIVSGIVLGDVGDDVVFGVQTGYKPVAFNTEFQIKNEKTIKVSDALVKVDVVMDNKIVIQQENNYSFTLRNTSNSKLSNVKVILEKPFGFTIAKPNSKDPKNPRISYDEALSSWIINELVQEEEMKIDYNGALSQTNVNAVDFVILVSIPEEDTERIVTRVKKTLFVVKPPIEITLSGNGSEDDIQTTDWEDIIEYKAVIKNTSQNVLKDVLVTIPVISKSFDISSFKSDILPSIDKEKRTVSWSQKEIPALAEMKTDDVIQVQWSLKIIPKPSDMSSFKSEDLKFPIMISTISKQQKETEENKTTETPEEITIRSSDMITHRIGNQILLDSYVLYNNAEKKPILGGPLPPTVGQETGYQIVWKLSSQPNQLEKTVVYAELPAYVLWKGSVISGDSLSYNDQTHEVRWAVGSVSGDGKIYEARFNVAVIPAETEVGKSLALVQTTRLNAEDMIEKKAVSITSALLSTNLIKDPKIIGQGIVKE